VNIDWAQALQIADDGLNLWGDSQVSVQEEAKEQSKIANDEDEWTEMEKPKESNQSVK
jgi:hypothetical protein